ncbi:MAG: hypothetical protein IKS20_05830, partial [Victivallales bacterium]|nr:hypothetical protein [Victivallales bacterium]
MNSKKILLVVSFICAFGIGVHAAEGQKEVSADGAASINADMKAYAKTSSELIEDAFKAFAKEREIASYGVPNAKGTVYFTGKARVSVNVNSPNFIKARAFAYEKAQMNAISEMVMDLTGTEMIKTIREYYSDESDDRLEEPKDLEEAKDAVSTKIKALTEAALDEGLRKLGQDPAKYGKQLEKKRALFKDSIYKQSIKKAVFRASGFLPVQTFESRTADGTYSIGVVLRMDADCVEIAKSLYLKRLPLIRMNGGLSIEEALPNDEELLTQFGVRLYFDEKGNPSLLSFGTFGSNYTGKNERRQERAMEHAFMQAEAIANEQLTTFINSTISVVEQSDKSDNEFEGVKFDENGAATEESFTKIIDRIMKSSTVTGFDTMKGRSTVKKVTLNHPSGHKIACVVRR